MSKLLKSIGLISALLILSSAILSAEESITITTYYPSPYGVYRELRSQRLAVGENYIMHDKVCWEGDPVNCDGSISGQTMIPSASNTDLIVEGNVGIGTAAPTRKLHLRDYSATGVPLAYFDYGSATDTTILEVGDTSHSSATRYLLRLTSDTDMDAGGPFTRMVVRTDGNVGIGTATPTKKLHIASPAATESSLMLQQAGQNNWMMGMSASSADLRISDTNLVSNPYLTIKATNGNVGIGTTAPTSVASPGNSIATGNLDVNDVWLRGANAGAGGWASSSGLLKVANPITAQTVSVSGSIWTSVNLSDVSSKSMVFLQLKGTGQYCVVRPKGDTANFPSHSMDANTHGANQGMVDNSRSPIVICPTDANGDIDIRCESAGSPIIRVLGYIPYS